jgi:succinate dehydrogenase/fumarate reductase cytochrome b subunit (b558 family)
MKMAKYPTPHINATPEDFGKTVLMPGDPKRSAYIAKTFTCPIYAVLYTVWLAALWFHLTHGFWSAIQTLGINNNVWFCRWKAIGNVVVTLIILGFFVVVVAGYFGMGALGQIEIAAPCATPCAVPCC